MKKKLEKSSNATFITLIPEKKGAVESGNQEFQTY